MSHFASCMHPIFVRFIDLVRDAEGWAWEVELNLDFWYMSGLF
jgi:hypothetical protein